MILAYLTLVIYVTDGVQRDFAVPFSFIKKEYVGVFVQVPNDRGFFTADPEPAGFSWLNDHTVRLNETPAAGRRVFVIRDTYADTPLVDFQDAAILIEEDLDLATLQALHVAQEARDSNLSHLDTALQYFRDDLAQFEEKMDETKASRIHAAQHAAGGADPVHPRAIGALEAPPATGKAYLATRTGWLEYNPQATDGVDTPTSAMVQYFEGDGISTEYVVDHPFATENATATPYIVDTDGSAERVLMRERVVNDSTIILKSAKPIPAGTRIRVIIIAAGKGTGLNELATKDFVADALAEVVDAADGVAEDLEYHVNDTDNPHQLTPSKIGAASNAVATADRNGLMSKADKIKLDSIDPSGSGEGGGTGGGGGYREPFVGTVVGNGVDKAFPVNHNLGTDKLLIQATDASGNLALFGRKDVTETSVTLTTAAALADGEVFTVIIMGGSVDSST